MYEEEAAAILGIPEEVTQVALLPIAYFTGDTFNAAGRIAAAERTHWGRWGKTR